MRQSLREIWHVIESFLLMVTMVGLVFLAGLQFSNWRTPIAIGIGLALVIWILVDLLRRKE